MKTINTAEVLKWLGARSEHKLVANIKSYSDTGEDMVKEKVSALFYLTLGSKKGPELFREMECEVTTRLTLEI